MTYVNRVAVVTGGASGIGREVAGALAERGAAVAVADINTEGAKSVAAALVQDGARAEAIAVDVSRPEQADAISARLTENGEIVYRIGEIVAGSDEPAEVDVNTVSDAWGW